jgi:hypothetical protein
LSNVVIAPAFVAPTSPPSTQQKERHIAMGGKAFATTNITTVAVADDGR